MRVTAIVLAEAIVVLAVTAGCGHVGREVDLVSKLGLEKTERIVVGVEVYKYYDPAAFDISDKDMIGGILSNFRHAKGVRSAKYETMGWVTFFVEGDREVKLELYGGSAPGGIAKVGRRFYAFDGKVPEMIRRYVREKRERNARGAIGLTGNQGIESAAMRPRDDRERAGGAAVVQQGPGSSGEGT